MVQSIAEQVYTQKGRNFDAVQGAVAYNLGAGNKRYNGLTGVDLFQGKGVDIVHNLDVYPWPLESSTADYVFGFQAFEHFSDLVAVMEEVHRISKNGARVVIEVPYFRHVGAFQDPTHKHFFTSQTMHYFHETQKRSRGVYSEAHFRLVGFWYGWPARSKNPLVRCYKYLITKYARWFDQSLLSLMLPPQILVFELEVCKD